MYGREVTDTPRPTLSRDLLAAIQPLLTQVRSRRTLSPGKLGILQHVLTEGRATTGELAAHIQVSPQAISLAAHELESLGLVERIPDTVDRRRIWIEATAVGRDRLDEELAQGHTWLARVIAERLSPAEVAVLEAAIPVLLAIGPEAQHD